MTSTGTAVPEHWGLDDPVGCLDADQELDTIELGDRALWWMTAWFGTRLYSTTPEREQAATGVLVAQVADATSHQGRPFPTDWLPAALTQEDASR